MAADGNVSVPVARCTGRAWRRCRGNGASPPPRPIAAAPCHVQAPGGRWSCVPAPAGRSPSPGNIRETSRNCQHDVSRNNRTGTAAGVPGCPPLCHCRGHPRDRRRRFATLSRAALSPDPQAASAILPKGLGRRRIAASRCPAWARQAGPPVTAPGGGARLPTAPGLPVARRTRHWSRPDGRRRPPRLRLAAMTARTPWVSARAGP
jgi:hypothetical protein